MKRLVLLLAVLFGFAAKGHADDSLIEQRVVEIHMTRIEPVTSDVKKSRKERKVDTLPYAGGTCSGSFVDDHGNILTARHCVNGFDSFEVQTYDNQRYEATVVATSTAHDLALIHIDRVNTPFFSLAERVDRGQRVFIIGSPLGITNTLSEGVVAKIDGDVTLLDCGALPGNSGSAVFDVNGDMIGVLNAGYTVGFGVTHLNQAQGRDAVYFFLLHNLAD